MMAQAQNNKKNLIGLTGVPLVMVLGNSMLIPILPTMKSELHLTSFQTSFLITAFSIAAGIIIPLAGYLSDRFNRKVVITIALTLYGAGGLLAGLASLWLTNPYWLIICGRVLQGIGAAGTSPIAMALVGDLFDGASESKALGLLETSNGLGKVLSPILGALFALWTWYAVFLAFPVICAVVLTIFLLLVKEKKQNKQPKSVKEYLGSIGQIFKQNGKWLIPAFFIGSICLSTLFGVLFYLSDLLEETYQIDGILKGAFLAIPLLALSIMAFITGAIIKKRLTVMRYFIIAGMLLLTISYAGASFVSNVYFLIGILVFGSVGTGMILPCLNSMIIGAVTKTERGMITSLYNGVRFIGVALGPPIFTWLLGFSTKVMFYSIASVTLLFAIIAFFTITPQKGSNSQGASQEGTVKKESSADGNSMDSSRSAGTKSEAESSAKEKSLLDQKALDEMTLLLEMREETKDQQKQEQLKKELGFDLGDLFEKLLTKKEKDKTK
ncbi:MFS transporter [Brevibacillus laterosporus]|uniref:MFS transporter n=1 Tax=Brevibacillus laterosporus TaxID=1465 RepID=UPI00041C2B98|nr:MFS transporter [Brevibacillus laterosporus]AYK04995.1 MFS transporter [Brevibacillus laterosporus]PCN45637.1 MFS transporter [Brevibacillus laterosporus]